MSLYFQIDPVSTNTEHGFITHEDRENSNLAFSVKGSVVQVDGDATTARKWAERTGVTEMTEADATLEIDKYKKAGAEAELVEVQAKEVELQDEIDTLASKIGTAEANK